MSRDRLYDEGEVTKIEGRTLMYGGVGHLRESRSEQTFGGWPESVPLPEVGDTVRFYGGFGRTVCGADVNGSPAWFLTVEEEDARHASFVAARHERQRLKFLDEEHELNTTFNALPPELQVRIEQLRRAGGQEWRERNESYELFVCEQAAVIATLGSEEAIMRWESIHSKNPPEGYAPYDYKRQHEELPGYSDQHSGNTHAVAVRLAIMLVNGKREAVLVSPQAIAPLAGDPRYDSRQVPPRVI